ncbi:MAG: hypothetical protein AAB680_02105, partial [Pseudomonadota bacterium]
MSFFNNIFSKPRNTASSKIVAQTHYLLLDDGREFRLTIKRMKVARQIRLRFTRDGQALSMAVPKNCSDKTALDFAHGSKVWIENQLHKKPVAVGFEIDGHIPIFGVPTILKLAKLRTKALLERGEFQVFHVPSSKINFTEKTKTALKKLALETANLHLQEFSGKTKRAPQR